LYDLRHVTALRISHREKTGAIYQFDLAYQFGYAIWVLTKKKYVYSCQFDQYEVFI